MRRDELKAMIDSTADPSFAVDSDGVVAAWNSASEKLFGLSTVMALGQRCGKLLKGTDECGAVCSENCTVRQAIANRHPLNNFDLQVETVEGRQWCNVSVFTVEDAASTRRLAIHVLRRIDLRKRLEILVRDFVVTSTSLTPENAVAMLSVNRAPAKDAELSPRELNVLRLLAHGESSKGIGAQLHISTTTVNNHVQHILKKLNAHNRLEAIRRAEHAGII